MISQHTCYRLINLLGTVLRVTTDIDREKRISVVQAEGNHLASRLADDHMFPKDSYDSTMCFISTPSGCGSYASLAVKSELMIQVFEMHECVQIHNYTDIRPASLHNNV
jgi:hypothetical protein